MEKTQNHSNNDKNNNKPINNGSINNQSINQSKENQNYDPKIREEYWRKFWDEHKIYAFDPNQTDKVFSIDTPPPTVSGKMHLGHSFMYSQMDFVARYKRMNGFNLIYPFGTDDNGLPTKLLIEKEKKVKATHMPRKEFVKLCIYSLEQEFRPKYLEDWKRIGTSCDFNLFYTTIGKNCQKISQKSLLDMYKNKRLYRKEAPAMYCPQCQTAISQVECEDKDISSFFNDIVFKTKDNSGKEIDIIVATTRPELLPACVAVFYHPDDSRYQHLAGKKAKVPLFNFEVPLLPDERADPEKGTGVVMCCTFGDKTDMEWQKAHHLPIKEAIGRNGLMTEISGKYVGMKIEDARKSIISDMKDKGLLLGQKAISHAVNVHERCGTPIEFIHSKQWFVKYLDLKPEMEKWGNDLNWFPNHMKNRYDNWVKGLEWDWCISRQVPFGVPFPIWYCEKCDEPIFAKESKIPVDPMDDSPSIKVCPKCGHNKFVPEKDTVNTWVTSSLSPTIAMDLIKGTKVYDAIKDKPMNMRPQGHDIITFWLFTTVVESQLHYNRLPWNDCFITGWALDPQGKKMSKSKGNVIEPQPMVEKYSADCLRLWAAGSKLGEDMPFQEKDFIGAKKTTTKIFNATKFAVMHLSDICKDELYNFDYDYLEEIDKWILSKSQEMIKQATEGFERYEFSKAKAAGENFFWHVLCDNYLEICKDRLYNPDKYENGEVKRRSAQIALYHSLLNVLKVLAPFASFITEEVYHMKFSEMENKKSIHNSSWPIFDQKLYNENISLVGDTLIDIISLIRKRKSENQKSMNAPVKILTIFSKKDISKILTNVSEDIKATVKAETIIFKDSNVDEINVELEYL